MASTSSTSGSSQRPRYGAMPRCGRGRRGWRPDLRRPWTNPARARSPRRDRLVDRDPGRVAGPAMPWARGHGLRLLRVDHVNSLAKTTLQLSPAEMRRRVMSLCTLACSDHAGRWADRGLDRPGGGRDVAYHRTGCHLSAGAGWRDCVSPGTHGVSITECPARMSTRPPG